MTITRRTAAALAVLLGLAIPQATSVVAIAEDVPAVIEFGTTSATIEYGEYWSFPVTMDWNFYSNLYGPSWYQVTTTGASGYAAQLSAYASDGIVNSYLATGYEVPPLGAGTYTFSISGTTTIGPMVHGETTTPATLKVDPAKLGIELRMIADPSNSDAALVTAKFTGRFIDEYSSSFFPGAALSPAGTWNITLKDADGEVAIERNVERAAGDDVLATSFYWADAEPGEQYTASASFVPSGVSANNFTIGAAQNFPYTAPESQRPVPTSSATAKPDTSLPEATGFGLPLWALILVIVLIVALAALVTILSVRLSRRPSTSTGEVQA